MYIYINCIYIYIKNHVYIYKLYIYIYIYIKNHVYVYIVKIIHIYMNGMYVPNELSKWHSGSHTSFASRRPGDPLHFAQLPLHLASGYPADGGWVGGWWRMGFELQEEFHLPAPSFRGGVWTLRACVGLHPLPSHPFGTPKGGSRSPKCFFWQNGSLFVLEKTWGQAWVFWWIKFLHMSRLGVKELSPGGGPS